MVIWVWSGSSFFFTYHHGVTYFLPFVSWNVLVIYEKEGVSPHHTLGAGGIPRANALAETTKFISVHGIPHGFKMGIAMELAMLKKFTSGRDKDQQGQWAISLQQRCTKMCKAIHLC